MFEIFQKKMLKRVLPISGQDGKIKQEKGKETEKREIQKEKRQSS